MIIFNKKLLHTDFVNSFQSSSKVLASKTKNLRSKEVNSLVRHKIDLTPSNKEFLVSLGFNLKK